MNRCVGFKLIALAIAQIFSSSVIAATFPTGRVEINAASTALVLQPALLLSKAPVSPEGSTGQNSNISLTSNASSPTPSSAANADAPAERNPTSPLALKLDTSLKNAAPASYDTNSTAGFSLVAMDPILAMGGEYSATPQVFASTTSGSASPAGGADASGTGTSAFDEMLPPLGRSAQLESTGRDAATDLTISDLMRFLDEFANDELASSTMRAPMIMSVSGLEDWESPLFLRPDAVVSEPGSLALFALSLIALRVARRRR